MVSDHLPHTPAIDHKHAKVADPDHAIEDIWPAAMAATIQDTLVTVDIGPIPSNPDTSRNMILPGLDTSTQGVGHSDKVVDATDLTVASLRGLSNIGPIKSLLQAKPVPSHIPVNTCTSPAVPTLKPSYSQVTRLGIRAYDPRKQHVIGAHDRPYDLQVLWGSCDPRACDPVKKTGDLLRDWLAT